MQILSGTPTFFDKAEYANFDVNQPFNEAIPTGW